jgi:hypothetical protein
MRNLTVLFKNGKSLFRSCLISLLLTAAGSPAAAADENSSVEPRTRTELLGGERQAKASATTAPQRSLVERALYWYDNQYVLAKVFGGWHGLHLAGGDFPAGAGMKFGAGFTRGLGRQWAGPDDPRPNRFQIDTVAAYSTRGYGRFSSGLSIRNLGGKPLELRVGGQYYRFPQEDFFGLGPDSRRENRTDYLLESAELGGSLHWKPAKRWEVDGGLFYVNPRTGRGTDSRFPSTELVFDPGTLPGLAKRVNFLRSDASAAFDWRDNPMHPHAGGRYGVKLSDFRDRELGAFDFRRVEVDVQQFVPLPSRYRTLALRATTVFTDAGPGQDVPFFYQPSLGGSHTLRGFREFRFRDRNALAFSAEYRWEAWWALDGALFVDAGKVAALRSDLNFRDLEVTYGVGFRLHSNRAFVARLDLAFSREGFIPFLRFEHVF